MAYYLRIQSAVLDNPPALKLYDWADVENFKEWLSKMDILSHVEHRYANEEDR